MLELFVFFYASEVPAGVQVNNRKGAETICYNLIQKNSGKVGPG